MFDGTCCLGQDEEKGEEQRDACFGPIYNSSLYHWSMYEFNKTFTVIREKIKLSNLNENMEIKVKVSFSHTCLKFSQISKPRH